MSPLLRRTPSARLDAPACRVTLQASSVLLAYPDDDLLARLPLLREALTNVPDAA